MTKKYFFSLILFVLLSFLLVSCTTGSVVEKPVKIGFLGPLSGDAAGVGQNSRAAVEIAVNEINNAGGINGRPLEVIYEDSRCNAKDAVTAAQKLVNIDGVVAIIGGFCSSETIAAAPIAEGKTVMISPGSSSPDVSYAGDYIFRTFPSDVFQGKFAAGFAYDELGARKIATLYCLSDWCVALNKRFQQEFESLGGEIILEQGYEQTTKDLRAPLIKIKDLNPDLIYFLGYTEATIIGFQQLKELEINIPVLGSDTWTDPGVQEKLGSTIDGALFAYQFTPENEEFKHKMKAHTGSDEVTVCTPNAYDATRILAGVMRKVGTNPEDIKNALYRVKYQGLTGEITFDKYGDVNTANYVAMQFKDGEMVEYGEQ
ncbi:ABC transporter substrate-binding protein [Candidatus Woesearchaeota archaeon]|nr:ABC transporter substrate-binding protein [Candidatus Woesearchaeota archaeon]